MTKQFEYYYLQRNAGLTWETIEESEAITVLTNGIGDRLTAIGGGEIRIVGASFDDRAEAWSYEQLFFIDPSKIDLGGAAPAGLPVRHAAAPGSTGGVVDHGEDEMFARLWSMKQPNGPERAASETHDTDPSDAPANAVNALDTGGPRPELNPRAMAGGSIPRPAAQGVDMRLAYLALVLGGTIAALSFGIRSGFGLYLGPISLEFGYGREVFALSLAIQNLIWGLTQPFAGAFADRYGPYRAIALGAVFYAGGTMLLSYSSSPEMFHLSSGVLVGIGLAGTSHGIIFSAVSQLFPAERRSWALGITGAAGSLGQFLVVPAGQQLMEAVGWSSSALILGFVSLLIIPMGLVFLKAKPAQSTDSRPDQTIGEALRGAFAHPSFWLLCAGFFVCGFHVAYIAIHLPSFVVDMGFSAQTGAWALGVVGLANVIGSYSAGVLGGKYPKKYLLSSLYFARAAIMAGFVLLPPSEILVYVFAATMGLVWLSTVPLTGGLVADIYGPRYMSTLFGIVFLCHQLGGFTGAWLGGYMFDTTGSYEVVWWISVGLGIFSGMVHWPIRPLPETRMATVPT